MHLQEVRILLKLAWPVILGQVGLMSMGLVDMVLVGRLGPEPLAALGIGNALGFGTLLVGLGAGAVPGVSIGDWAILGAGAMAVGDLPARVTAVGVPARRQDDG